GLFAHLVLVRDRTARLSFEIVGPAVPELPFVVGGIPQAWGAASQHLATTALGPYAVSTQAHAQLATIGKTVIGMMAVSARNRIRAAENRIEEQELAQFDLLRRHWVLVQRSHRRKGSLQAGGA